LAKQSFDGKRLPAIGIAFEAACGSLGLAVAQDPLTDIIIDKIIGKIVEAARSGESDSRFRSQLVAPKAPGTFPREPI
jgi:hypothetical protein